MQPNVWVYILQCADGSYYVGKYQGWDLDRRVSEHNEAVYPDAYTARRRPVRLAWNTWFTRFDDAVHFERQIKGWSRAKKEALMRDNEAALRALSRRGYRPAQSASALRDASAVAAAPQGEGFLAATAPLHPEEARSAVPKDALRDASAVAAAPQGEGSLAATAPLHPEEVRSALPKDAPREAPAVADASPGEGPS